MLTEEIVQLFNAKGQNGHYKALCPCHQDKNPSLSITAKNGVILIHCFAGCNVKDIVEAVGLTISDLWDERNTEE